MDLFSYLQNGKTAYHSVAETASMLSGAAFNALNEHDVWDLKAGDGFFVQRNSSSLFAFKIPQNIQIKGAIIAATHSDSPTYKLKVNPILHKDKHYISLNVSGYGGMIHPTFLDRPLSIAGRIFIENNGDLKQILVDLNDISIIIPNLAIHMNRNINNGYEYKIGKDMLPILCQTNTYRTNIFDREIFPPDRQKEFLQTGQSNTIKGRNINPESISLADIFGYNEILGHDLFLYSKDSPSYLGLNNEFFGSPRIDNLECSYIAAKSLIDCIPSNYISAFAMLDNEEVGSSGRQGADSTFITDCLAKIYENLNMNVSSQKIFEAGSFMLSCDNAHGLHPNYVDKSDPVNRPYLNEGVVIKHSTNQKYTTDGHSSARLKLFCKNHNIPYQDFENPSDIAGGSTLGNISAKHLSIPAVDIGLAQWAMHSAFEIAGSRDLEFMYRLLSSAFSAESI